MSPIRLMKPYVSFDEVEKDFREVFESGIFTRGRHVEAFRNEISRFTGARHAFLTTSATTALWICLKLLKVGQGDEVIVSDFSFPATANVVEDLGARPIFADVSLETFNMHPDALLSLIGPRTKAVIFVDALGNPTGLTEIQEICRHHKIPLIEDAACAIGSAEKGLRCGSIADLTCFSFHPRKLISTGEGGAIVTGNDEWAEWLDIKLAHGAKGMKGVALDFIDYGYNFRLSELQAIMGLRQLVKIEALVDERNDVRNAYIGSLQERGFVPQKIGEGVRFNVQSLAFKVPEGCNRDSLISGLKQRGIESTIGTYSLSGTTYFSEKYAAWNPNSKFLEERAITLPCYASVDHRYVADAICQVLEVQRI